MAIEILGTGQSDGTAMVKSITEKVHLYGGTGVAQRASADQAVVGAALPALSSEGTVGWDTAGDAILANDRINEIRVLILEMRTVLINLGLMKGAA